MDTPGKRLIWARRRKGFTEAVQASRAFGWNDSTYHGHENGDRNPSRAAAKRYGKAFQVRWEWLLEAEGDPVPKPQPRGAAISVPLYSWVSAGRMLAADPVSNVDILKHIDVADLPPGGDWAALEVRGDSMDRVAPDGSIIIIDRKDETLRTDRYYVIATEAGEATFKRFRSNPDRLQPFSTNPDQETQLLDGPIKVFGRVRRVIIELA